MFRQKFLGFLTILFANGAVGAVVLRLVPFTLAPCKCSAILDVNEEYRKEVCYKFKNKTVISVTDGDCNHPSPECDAHPIASCQATVSVDVELIANCPCDPAVVEYEDGTYTFTGPGTQTLTNNVVSACDVEHLSQKLLMWHGFCGTGSATNSELEMVLLCHACGAGP